MVTYPYEWKITDRNKNIGQKNPFQLISALNDRQKANPPVEPKTNFEMLF